MNFVHIFGSIVLIIFIIQNIIKGSYFDAVACSFMALIAIIGFSISRTKVVHVIPANISMISFGLFCIMLIWNGDAQGAGFLFIFIYPLLTVILLGMAKGIIYSVVLFLIVCIEFFVPGVSRFNYHPDTSLRMAAVYILVLSITLVFERSRKNKDKEIEKQKDELLNYNNNLEQMVQEKTRTIIVLKNAVMETIADLVERRDNTTGGHILRTSNYMRIIIEAIIKEKLYHEQTALWNIEQMILSSQLHDVGKIGIDDIILQKPGKLSDVEFETMKRHTLLGGDIIKEIQQKTGESEFLDYAFIFAVYHHEKWNGTGYPYNISNEKIPLPARLMAIIDVYDALLSARPYKKPFLHEEAIKIISDGKGSSFDPLLTELFLSVAHQLKGALK
jgi:HD-GYP domain-containing protein (c-di-GMP phosphodiesterase class II)